MMLSDAQRATGRFLAVGGIVLSLVGLSPQAREQVDQSVLSVLVEYERTGAVAPVMFRDVKTLIGALDRTAERWIPGLPDAAPRRRKLLALFPLEIVWSNRSRPPSDALELLRWGRARARQTLDIEFERRWLLVSVGLVQRAPEVFFGQATSPAARAHLEYAADRFPDHSRFQLALLLSRPESMVLSSRPGADPKVVATPRQHRRLPGREIDPAQITATLRRFELLSGDSEVGGEARLHAALLKFHLNRLPEALSDVAELVRSSDDPFVVNLASLVAGFAEQTSGRPDEALRFFRLAHAAWPDSRSSALALAAALFLSGQRAEASDLLDRSFAGTLPEVDPWMQVAGDVRFGAQHLAELRRSADLPARMDLPVDAARGPSAPTGARPIEPNSVSTPGAVPAFRARARAVAVDVSIQGAAGAGGLGVGDFALFDNGVTQTITDVSLEPVPLDITLVAAFEEFGSTELRAQAQQLARDLRSIAATISDRDRLRVLIATKTPLELVPLQARPVVPSQIRLPNGEVLPLELLSQSRAGMSSYGRSIALYDAVASALMMATSPDRRHLVIVFSNGVDDESVITGSVTQQVAARADALAYVARSKTVDETRLEGRGRILVSAYASHLWLPDPKRVADIVGATGGRLAFRGGTSSMADEVGAILESFRSRYILRYQPSGVPEGGWHDISVRVTRPGDHKISARRGYFGGE